MEKQSKSAWRQAKEAGVDVSLIRLNMRKTYSERVLDLQNAPVFVEQLKAAGRRYYDQIRRTHKTTPPK